LNWRIGENGMNYIFAFDELREKLLELSNKLNSLHRYQLGSSTTKQLGELSQINNFPVQQLNKEHK
jgi:hypothetical protein